MKKLVNIILILIPVIISGQNNNFKKERKISWGENKYLPTENRYYLHFKDACYEDPESLFPSFYELLPVSGEGYSVRITNQHFESLNSGKAKQINNLKELTKNLQISQTTVYIRKKTYLAVSFIPLVKTGQTAKKLVSFSFELSGQKKSAVTTTKHKSFAQNSVLSQGKWIKIKLEEEGIYKLTHNKLKDYGIDNPANVRVYGNGGKMLPELNNLPRKDDLQEIPLYMYKGSDDEFSGNDYILFYAQGSDNIMYDNNNNLFIKDIHDFSQETYYFITADYGPGKRIASQNGSSQNPTQTSSTFDAILHHEINEKNLIESGRQWFGESFASQSVHNFNFDLKEIDVNQPVSVIVSAAARYSSQSNFSVFFNENYLSGFTTNGVSMSSPTLPYASYNSTFATVMTNSSDAKISISFNNTSPAAEAWLDYLTINYRRKLALTGSSLIFQDYSATGNNNITRFTISNADENTQVWDISDINETFRVNGALTGSNYSITVSTDTLKRFAIVDTRGNFSAPEHVEEVDNQNLHALNNIQMVIVTHPDFKKEADTIAALHRNKDYLNVTVVTPQEVYNEFSSGMPDVCAIRDFMKMLYDRDNNESTMLRYLLLVGDGSYDNKTALSENTNKIITYQSHESIDQDESYVSDDFFGMLDDNEGNMASNNKLDIGIGRIPCNTSAEINAVLEKIKYYTSNTAIGDWRNEICFIGDDEDGNRHMKDADSLARFIKNRYPQFNVDKIYLDAYEQTSSSVGERYPEVNKAIYNKIHKGILLFNYTGHGGEGGMAHEQIINVTDILGWKNKNLPLFVTATCEFSRYDNYQRTSAGEYVLLNPNGGAFALLTTTRLVYSGPNHQLNVNFYKYIFENDTLGNPYRLGDVLRLTKNITGSAVNKRNFSLLGDPAIKLCYPMHNIVADSINGKNIASFTDTIKALEKVTISGHIENVNGNSMSGFNGVVYPRIFDKEKDVETLSNDGEGIFNFKLQNSVLYRGKASVNSGRFRFTFIVPKDISYAIGNGKLSFYAENEITDAAGYNNDILIGGSSGNVDSDKIGPKLKLYMNDENFVSGGMTDENPLLLAIVSDSSGINTVGNGIGHDITAELDDQSGQVYILNDYYEAELDNYQKGRVEYPMSEIASGEHKLNFKIWDVYNNSSEDYIEFIVEESEELVLKRLLNYPNPFTTKTSFYFEHNRPNQSIQVLIQVITMSGKLVKTISVDLDPEGYKCGPIDWDGLDDFGDKIGKGVYIYRVKVKTGNEMAEKYQKLVILR